MKELISQFNNLLFAFNLALANARSRIIRYIFFSVLSNLVIFGFDVYFLAHIMSLLIDGASWDRVLAACLYGAVLVIVRIASSEYAAVMKAGFSRINMEMINRDLYEKSLEHDLSEYHNAKFYDEYSFVLQNGASNVNRSVDIIAQIITAVIYLGIFVFEMFRQSVLIITLMIAMIAFNSLINYFSNKKLTNIRYDNNIALQPDIRRKDYFKRLFYLKSYAYDIKNYVIYNRLNEEYFHSVREYEDKLIGGYKKEIGWSFLQNLHSNLFLHILAPVILITAFRYEGINSVSMYWQVSGLLIKLTGLYLFNAHADIMSLSKYISKFKEFINKKVKASVCTSEAQILSGICVRNLSFSYDSNSDFSLKNINIDIRQGEKIAIVGRNGSGKTTLMNLLLGLYTPTEGEIIINGENISLSRKAFTKNTIGLMCQNFNLYYVSLKDNIKMGDNSYTDDEVMEAAELAQCGEFLGSLENGIDTTIGKEIDETATELSGGQAQRIAMARILLSKAPVIFMDEPTAAIDPIFERAVTDNLMRKIDGKTTVIITHRLDITRYVDRIYVMENGAVIETGTFNELMGKKSVFSDMYRSQNEVENDETK